MALENPDIQQMVEDAAAEVEEISGRDRTRGKTMYTRKALVKIFRMTKAERAAYQPKNGFEEAALAHLDRCLLTKGTGTQALALLRDTLGEQSAKQKEEKNKPSVFDGVIDDLPRADRLAN